MKIHRDSGRTETKESKYFYLGSHIDWLDIGNILAFSLLLGKGWAEFENLAQCLEFFVENVPFGRLLGAC